MSGAERRNKRSEVRYEVRSEDKIKEEKRREEKRREEERREEKRREEKRREEKRREEECEFLHLSSLFFSSLLSSPMCVCEYLSHICLLNAAACSGSTACDGEEM